MWITRHPGVRTRSGAGSMLFNESMQYTKNGLKLEGFSGFKPIEDLAIMREPASSPSSHPRTSSRAS